MCDLSIIIPVYNESEALESCIAEIKEITKDISKEILIVLDGSNEDTIQIAHSLSDEDVRVIHLKKNKGQHYATFRGLREANGRCLCVCDCDGQDSYTNILLMFQAWKSGFDGVFTIQYTREKGNVLYNFFTNILYSYLNLGTSIPKNLIDFYLIDRDVLGDLLCDYKASYYLKGSLFSYCTSRLLLNVKRESRKAGKSQYNLFSRIKLALKYILSFSNVNLLYTECGIMALISFLLYINNIIKPINIIIWVLLYLLIRTTVYEILCARLYETQ